MPELLSGEDIVRIKTPEGCEVVAPASHWLKCFAAYTMGVQADAALLEACKAAVEPFELWPTPPPAETIDRIRNAIAKAEEVNRE